MNLLDGVLNGNMAVLDAGKFSLPITNPRGSDGDRIRFGIRPEDVVLDPNGPATGRVFDIENHGVIKILTLAIEGTHLHATVSAQTKVSIDETVKFSWKPDKVLFFNPTNGQNMDLG